MLRNERDVGCMMWRVVFFRIIGIDNRRVLTEREKEDVSILNVVPVKGCRFSDMKVGRFGRVLIEPNYEVRGLISQGNIEGRRPVSYTHLDVYKRQRFFLRLKQLVLFRVFARL